MDLGKEQDAGTNLGRLESLSISGFRGIGELTIPKLGRITLLAGQNGVGKTTVLDAVRLYAAGGRLDALRELLIRREELMTYQDEDGGIVDAPAFDRLFHRDGDANPTATIGPKCGPVLKLREDFDAEEKLLKVAFGSRERTYPERKSVADLDSFRRLLRRKSDGPIAQTPCESLGPGLLRNRDLARLWDGVALTDDETLARDALRLIFGGRVERTAVIGQPPRSRRVVVKLSDHTHPVPLKSLGDGATRMFGVALALANCRDGILLLDEAENGIHYSLQSEFWNMILCAAEKHNTQVLATTHSKDSIDGFADAASASPDIDANLVRIGWRDGKLRAVGYSIEDLEAVAEQNFEVR